ncbi:uncharacterized protein [Rutidosis leptorrhynchoides]|uniref:uncharacterized protein n=1 Tax=Rutidosis leptorrhynchoides TaxID=125765 RepID=UPI003A9903F7
MKKFLGDNLEFLLSDSDSDIALDYCNSESIDSKEMVSGDESIEPVDEFEKDNESCDHDGFESVKIPGFWPCNGEVLVRDEVPGEEDLQSGCIGVDKIFTGNEEVVAETMSSNTPKPSPKRSPRGGNTAGGILEANKRAQGSNDNYSACSGSQIRIDPMLNETLNSGPNLQHVGPNDNFCDANLGGPYNNKCDDPAGKCDSPRIGPDPVNTSRSAESIDDSLNIPKQAAKKSGKTTTSVHSEKLNSVSISNCCYMNAMGNWKTSTRIMKLQKLARDGDKLGVDKKMNCKSCRLIAKKKGKFGWVKGLISNENLDIAVFQETRCKKLDDAWVYSLWGSSDVGYIQKEVIGKSGGMLVIWDAKRFVVDSVGGNEFYLAIRGKWVGTGFESTIINVYGPHNDNDKNRMWEALDILLGNHDSGWVLCGDFNEVREQSDWLNCVFHQHCARRFNEFIVRNNLIEIPINGRKFTRVSDDGRKFSKLDRFLVSDAFINCKKDLSIMILDRKDSYHCPLILRDKFIDFGPKPFKVFDEWLHKEGIDRVIQDGWDKPTIGSRKDCCFRDKLKNIKGDLKVWSKKEFGGIDEEISRLKNSAMKWELKAENGLLSKAERLCWLEERMNWILDGDEKSKYFYASLKRRYNKCNVRSLNIDGCWCDDPNTIKDAVYDYYKNIFSEKLGPRPKLLNIFNGTGPIGPNPVIRRPASVAPVPDQSGLSHASVSADAGPVGPTVYSRPVSTVGLELCKLSSADASNLEVPFSESEVWEAIKECGSTKAPGPDGFNMRNWILSCLESASISVLVNGSPTREFKLKRGVRQGDPLSPFLFILAAEGLNLITKSAVCNNMFRGVEIGTDKIQISHLQYANDTIFFGEWSENNLRNLMKLLKCFELTLGLKVNYNKSNLYGVGVENMVIESMARLYKCKVGSFPFIYLGLSVGGKMNKLENWNSVIDKFTKQLSDWKARTMSFGGRLTLVKSVLKSLPLYYFSPFREPPCVLKKLEYVRHSFFWGGTGKSHKIAWVKWDETLLPFENGGLNIGSLKCKNLALIGKWWWRFKSETTSLWVKVISSIYGPTGGLCVENLKTKFLYCSVWSNIIKSGNYIDSLGVIFRSSFIKNIGNGASTSFWNDVWLGSTPLKNRFKRLSYLETNLDAEVQDRLCWDGTKWVGNWAWTREVSGRAIGELEDLNGLLSKVRINTNEADCWIWAPGSKGRKGRLQKLTELDNKRIDLNSVRCPICDNDIESLDHSLLSCKLSGDIWGKILDWLNVSDINSNNIQDLFDMEACGNLSDVGRGICKGIVWTSGYLIWKNRNDKVFKNKCWNVPVVVSEIQVKSFDWIAKRCKVKNLEWHTWLQNPATYLT